MVQTLSLTAKVKVTTLSQTGYVLCLSSKGLLQFSINLINLANNNDAENVLHSVTSYYDFSIAYRSYYKYKGISGNERSE